MTDKVTKLEDMSGKGRFWFGLIFVIFGTPPMLSAFNIGPLTTADINGPPWLGFAAGGVFVLAGCAIWAGNRRPSINAVLVLTLVAGLAAIANWISFGVGPRVCSGSILFWWEGGMSGLGCRIPFGMGALITNGMVLLILVHTLQKALGGPPKLSRLRKWTESLFFLTLLPILLPIGIFLLLTVGVTVIKTRLKTGQWPRNESYIGRMKTRKRQGAARDSDP